MRKLLIILFIFCSCLTHAQMLDPVKFHTALTTSADGTGVITFTAYIEKGWHVYSTNLGSDGPVSATLRVNSLNGVKLVGRLTPSAGEVTRYDYAFRRNVRYFEHQAVFRQKVKFTKPKYSINVSLEYGACSDHNCLPPDEVPFVKTGTSSKAASIKEKDDKAADGNKLAALPEADTATAKATAPAIQPATIKTDNTASVNGPLWKPVTKDMPSNDGSDDIASQSLAYIFLMGLLGGLLAVAMPCVWPVIPMTVSFFIRRGENRRQGIRSALAYGASIVVIYMLLGIAVTLLLGPSGLNDIATSALFNVLLFVLLIMFALSLFGCFELQLPARWANAADSRAGNAGGLLSVFLMALTLVLVSFSCTAPIIGLLLAGTAVSGNYLAPAAGMLGFAVALALPFMLFAMFPSWLKSMPKSGSWMNIIKVTLGFIELAFSLKFLSVADMAYGWHLLSRTTFLCLWIAIFLFLAFYLSGIIHFRSDGDSRPHPVVSVMLGMLSAAFAIYMLPGLWGAPVPAVSAFAPPATDTDFSLSKTTAKARFTSYEDGMAAARAEGKPVLLDFTGYGCVNCRKMEGAVWTDRRVADMLNNDFVLISLYCDDKTPLPQPITVTESGRQRTLRTTGDKWSYLERHKFGSNALPYYVAVTADGKPLSPSRGYDEDVAAYTAFLDKALKKFREQ